MVQTSSESLIGQRAPLPLPLPPIVKPSWHHHIAIVHAFHDNMSASSTVVSPKPTVLLLGEIVIAHAEWDSLAAIAELRVSKHEVQTENPIFCPLQRHFFHIPPIEPNSQVCIRHEG